MFKFLKDKLKSALDSFSKKVEEKSEDTEKRFSVSGVPEIQRISGDLAEEKLPDSKFKAEIKEEPKKISEGKIPEDFKEALKEEALEAAEEEFIEAAGEDITSHKTEQELFADGLKKAEESGLDVSEAKLLSTLKNAEGIFDVSEPKVLRAEEAKKESGVFSKIKGLFSKKEEQKPKEKVQLHEQLKEKIPEKKGIKEIIAEKITKKIISEKEFEELFTELEVALLENNVAVEVMEKIKNDMKKVLVNRPIPRNKVKETIVITLKSSIGHLFDAEKIDLIRKAKGKKPFIILFFGVNGSGKTTTIAKLAKLFEDNGMKCVIAASDTFRAAAIQQLEEHAAKLNIPLIKKDYGADPAAVAFDAIKYAESKKLDIILIDTAGRLHSNVNLMDEMRKMVKVSKPDMKIFIGESITGNDCVEQAKKFNEALEFDAIILSKADVDEKGGAAISVSYVTKKPIIYMGTGQSYSDLKPFNPEMVVESLGL